MKKKEKENKYKIEKKRWGKFGKTKLGRQRIQDLIFPLDVHKFMGSDDPD